MAGLNPHDRLHELFERMDRAYADTARALGLTCEGCEDNCCLSLFHHHTSVERLFLREGLVGLPVQDRERIVDAARSYQKAEQVGAARAAIPCPLLANGCCVLYAYRPMICRLHGVPWVLQDGRRERNLRPGCSRAMALWEQNEVPPLDRTPLYAELAELEQQARTEIGHTGPIRATVADMILSIAEEEGW